jgi:hypothetical protein
MRLRRSLLLSVSLTAALAASALSVALFWSRAVATDQRQATSRLTDRELWKLSTDLSEQDGTFHSENLLSNEGRFQYVLPTLDKSAVQGRAYLGVGSEQNFTYIVATRPAMAFIVDIRRGNLLLHLTYKALFELSSDRAEFVSKLFSRPRPGGLSTTSTAQQIFDAYASAEPSRALHDRNLKAIKAHLTTTHGFGLTANDLEGIDFVYGAWFEGGPEMRYQLTNGFGGGGFGGGGFGGGFGGRRGGPGGMPSYAELMTADDGTGHARSYLATEENYRYMRDFETRNLLVPVVGDFGGPKALRAVASYLKQKALVVSTFYASNVEQYLYQNGIWDRFCGSAATLPLDAKSLLIRSRRGGFRGAGPGGGPGPRGMFSSDAVPLQPEVITCTAR